LRRKPFGLEVKKNLSRLRSTRKVRSFARNSVTASDLVNDLLVDEKVGGVLEHLHAQPVRPQLFVEHIIEVQTVEILHDLIPAGNQVASFPPRVVKEGQPSQQSAEHRALAGPTQVE
jgi:hypothetical protein